MKLTIERSALLTSLGHIQGVVERRNTIPILSNVQIEATDGAVGFTATDLDLAIFERVDAEIATAVADLHRLTRGGILPGNLVWCHETSKRTTPPLE